MTNSSLRKETRGEKHECMYDECNKKIDRNAEIDGYRLCEEHDTKRIRKQRDYEKTVARERHNEHVEEKLPPQDKMIENNRNNRK